ncbi:uncharacterized protein [Ptychodera flava]|uniref:uncharacterized protein n=1 Tax=Ptychodera flava TaxID=63121 RepID=UPI00396A862B
MKHLLALCLIVVVCGTLTVFGFENVAVGKPASQSSLYTASYPAGAQNAVDGNTDSNWSSKSCTHTLQEQNPWWKVDLQNIYKVDEVVIINRKDCCSERLEGAIVRVGSSSDITSNTQCGNTVTSHEISKSITTTFDCSDGINGRYVSVQLEGRNQFLTLCEVEVYGTLLSENIAVGKRASQSSLYTASYPAGAQNAVDGNTDSNWSSKSCTHTLQQQNSWWKVDLQNTYNVDQVVITNRKDCCSERLEGAVVRVGSSSNIASNTQCGNTVTSYRISKSITMTFDCSDGTNGRYVSVQLEGRNQFLTLCEVEVYGTLLSENIAVGKPASQSSLYTASYPAGAENAVDGNTDSNWPGKSCTHTLQQQNSWWKVDLQNIYNVDQVVITNRKDCCSERLVGAVVRVGSCSDIQRNSQCGNTVTSDHITKSITIPFNCNVGTKGRYVSVQLEGQNNFLTLCEVEVYETLSIVTPPPPPPPPTTTAIATPPPPTATTIPTLEPCEFPASLHNVAQGKPTVQSSDKRRKDSGSENAVDGDFNTNANKGSCSWTEKEYQPWWKVDLGQTYNIYEVVITNREDCCPFRLKNAEIRVGDSENFEDNPTCGMMILGRMVKENPVHVRCGCDTPMQGRYVSVQLIDRTQMLTMCEVEVMVA